VLLFAATRGFILVTLEPAGSDLPLYLEYAHRAIDLGETPYTSAFQIEYPPLAWWVVSGVRRLNGAPLRREYARTFRGIMCTADVVSFWLFAGIVRRRCPGALGLTLITYTVVTALLGHLLYDRLDVGLLMLLLAWAYCWTRRSGGRGASIGWVIGAYGAVGLGIAYKLVPILAAPFLLLAEWRGAGRRTMTLAVVALAAATAFPFVLQYEASGSGALGFLTYQAGRGIEIESLYATIMAAASLVGPPIAATLSHSGTDLTGPLAPAMKALRTMALAGLVGGLALWALRRGDRYTRTAAYQVSCLAITATIVLSNVLTPQYFIWTLPMMLLLATDLFGETPRTHLLAAGLLIALAGLTTWVFPYHFYYADGTTPLALVPIRGDRPLAPSPWPFIVLGVRNVLYLMLAGWLGRRLVTRPDLSRSSGPAAPSPSR
jgi:hypothetical protein